MSLTNTTTTLAEDADTSSAVKVADIVITDDGLGTNDLSLTGTDAGMFEIVGSELYLSAGATLNFETNPTLDVTVAVDDTSVGATPDDTAALAITITDVNEAPSASDDTFALAEDAANGTVVGTVSANDPDAGDILTYNITAGNDDGVFAINSSTGEVTIADNTNLDFETTTSYLLTTQVNDSGTLTDTAGITIVVTNVNDIPPDNASEFSLESEPESPTPPEIPGPEIEPPGFSHDDPSTDDVPLDTYIGIVTNTGGGSDLVDETVSDDPEPDNGDVEETEPETQPVDEIVAKADTEESADSESDDTVSETEEDVQTTSEETPQLTDQISNEGDVVAEASGSQAWQAGGTVEDLSFITSPELLSKDLDSFHDKIISAEITPKLAAGTASVVVMGLSVGYFVWAIRAGWLISSLLSSIPPWRIVDPLPILSQPDSEKDKEKKRARADDNDTEETLESLADGGYEPYRQGKDS